MSKPSGAYNIESGGRGKFEDIQHGPGPIILGLNESGYLARQLSRHEIVKNLKKETDFLTYIVEVGCQNPHLGRSKEWIQ